jgi:hypothetical protein
MPDGLEQQSRCRRRTLPILKEHRPMAVQPAQAAEYSALIAESSPARRTAATLGEVFRTKTV